MASRTHPAGTQRRRQVVAVVGYLVALAVGVAVLTTLSRGPGGVLLSIGWALVLLVPLAVVAVTPRVREPGSQDHLPVLMRSKTTDPDR